MTAVIYLLTGAALIPQGWAAHADGPALAGAAVQAVSSVRSESGVRSDSTVWAGVALVEPSVRAAIAERWEVEPSDLVLEWGRARSGWTPGPDARVRLRGSGSRGWWVAEVDGADGSTSVRLRAGTPRTVPVAARRMARGTTLTEADLMRVERTVWGPPVPNAPGVRPGWVVRRLLEKGEPLEPPAVTPPDAVVAGSPVHVEWVRGPVALTLPARALGTVAEGEPVYVRTETGERLRGLAVGPGRVRVSPYN